jgi:two-component system, OmpR family, response regulator
MHLLLVEDDERLRRLLTRLFVEQRHVVEAVGTGREALEIVALTRGIDVVVLDLGLPDMSGLEVARAIRAQPDSIGILMLTARDTVADRVAGLDHGADDYLVKPFAFAELAARVRALGRRNVSASLRPDAILGAGSIRINETTRSVTVGGHEVALSPREYSLLECFLRHPGQVLTRDQLLDHAWPFGAAVTPNAVDAYVHYLRQKLGESAACLTTIRGVGYRLDDA